MSLATTPSTYNYDTNGSFVVWKANNTKVTISSDDNTGATLTAGDVAGEVTITAEVYYTTEIGSEPFTTPVKDTYVVTVTSI